MNELINDLMNVFAFVSYNSDKTMLIILGKTSNDNAIKAILERNAKAIIQSYKLDNFNYYSVLADNVAQGA